MPIFFKNVPLQETNRAFPTDFQTHRSKESRRIDFIALSSGDGPEDSGGRGGSIRAAPPGVCLLSQRRENGLLAIDRGGPRF